MRKFRRRVPKKTASNASECENLPELFKVLGERNESPQGQEAARCHKSSAGVFVLSEQAKAQGLVEMLGAI